MQFIFIHYSNRRNLHTPVNIVQWWITKYIEYYCIISVSKHCDAFFLTYVTNSYFVLFCSKLLFCVPLNKYRFILTTGIIFFEIIWSTWYLIGALKSTTISVESSLLFSKLYFANLLKAPNYEYYRWYYH